LSRWITTESGMRAGIIKISVLVHVRSRISVSGHGQTFGYELRWATSVMCHVSPEFSLATVLYQDRTWTNVGHSAALGIAWSDVGHPAALVIAAVSDYKSNVMWCRPFGGITDPARIVTLMHSASGIDLRFTPADFRRTHIIFFCTVQL
jgi:hypothetical protein